MGIEHSREFPIEKFTEKEWDEFTSIYDDAVYDYCIELGIEPGTKGGKMLDTIRDKIYQLAPGP